MSAETIVHAAINTDESSPVPPHRIAAFRILSLLGEGGVGVVYCAEQDSPNRRVALKLLKRVGPQSLRRFKREAESLGKFQHRGIAQIYASGEADTITGKVPFIAMELIKGMPITRHAGDKRLGVQDRLSLLLAVCDAISYAHSNGVIHRDLKPSNIIITPNGEAKVLDFGLSLDTDAQATLATEPGQIMGTLAYMSPEQAEGRTVDCRTDVYSLGVIAYELLAGQRPYEVPADNPLLAIRHIAETEPPSLATINRSLRGDLDTILAKALEKDPARRYPTAAAFSDDIRRYIMHEPIHARPATLVYRAVKFTRRHKALVIGTLAVIITLIAGVIATTRETIVARREEKRAVAAERSANVHLADALLSSGRAWFAAGKLNEAREAYLEAWDKLESLGEPTYPAQLGLWDVNRQCPRPVARWKAHESTVTSVAVSEKGAVAITSSGNVVKVWNLQSLQELFNLKTAGNVELVAMSSDGKRCAFTTASGATALVDVAARQVIAQWKGERSLALNFSADGSKLAWTSDRSVMMVDANAGSTPKSIYTSADTVAKLLPVTAGWLVVGTSGEIAVTDGQQILHKWKHAANVRGATTLHGKTTVALSDAKSVGIYQLDGTEVQRLAQGSDQLVPVGDNEESLLCVRGPSAIVCDPVSGKQKWNIFPWDSTFFSASSSGTTLFAGFSDGNVAFFNTSLDQEFAKRTYATAGPVFLALAANQKFITASSDGTMMWWDFTTKSVLARQNVSETIAGITSCRSTESAYISSADGRILRWDLANPSKLEELPRLLSPCGITLSPDGQTLGGVIQGSVSGSSVAFWACEDGALGAKGSTWVLDGPMKSAVQLVWQNSEIAFVYDIDGAIWEINVRNRHVSRNGQTTLNAIFLEPMPQKRWATMTQTGLTNIHDSGGGAIRAFPECSSYPVMLAFLSGRYLSTAEMNGTIRFKDWTSNRTIGPIDLGITNITDMAISRDGSIAIAATESGDVLFLNLDSVIQERRISGKISNGIANERTPLATYQEWLTLRHPRIAAHTTR